MNVGLLPDGHQLYQTKVPPLDLGAVEQNGPLPPRDLRSQWRAANVYDATCLTLRGLDATLLPCDEMLDDDSFVVTPRTRHRLARLFHLPDTMSSNAGGDPWAVRVDATGWSLHAHAFQSSVDINKLCDSAASLPSEYGEMCEWTKSFLEDPDHGCHRPIVSLRPEWMIHRSQLLPGDVEVIQKTGIADICVGEDALLDITTLAFWVPEPSKIPPRRRLICDTLFANATAARPRKVRLQTIGQVCAWATMPDTFFVTFDMKAWFFQFTFSEAVSRKYVLGIGQRKMRMLRMPMGHKASVAAAHGTAVVLGALAMYRARTSLVQMDVILDNLLFAGPFCQVLAATNAFVDVCREHNVVIGEQTAISRRVVHRGADIDAIHQTVCLKHSWVSKFQERVKQVCQKGWAKWSQIQSILGMLNWTRAVLQRSAPDNFLVWKWAARIAASQPKLGTRILLPEYVAERLRFNADKLPNIHRALYQRAPSETLLFTDASKAFPFARAGAVLLFPDGRFYTFGKEFPLECTLSINALEGYAVVEALTFFSKKLRYQQGVQILNVHVDNQALIGAAKTGTSPSLPMHSVVNHILSLAAALGRDIEWHYIHTSLNPSDDPSRGLNVELRKLLPFLDDANPPAPQQNEDELFEAACVDRLAEFKRMRGAPTSTLRCREREIGR